MTIRIRSLPVSGTRERKDLAIRRQKQVKDREGN
jgi:hypothetical protein